MRVLLERGLAATAAWWPELEQAYALVYEAAHLLENAEGRSGSEVAQRYARLLGQMRKRAVLPGPLQSAYLAFLKVTESYHPGLFHCYDVADLPRTNNALEHLFGSVRYHERRSSGRKVAAPSLVLRGAVRVWALVATRLKRVTELALPPRAIEPWRQLRARLEVQRQARVQRYRFRRHPVSYLKRLENLLLKPALLS